MQTSRRFVSYWLPVILWMGMIFWGSGAQLSMQHTSRFLGPLIHRIFPSLSPEQVDEMVFTIRKMSHVTEYAVLSLLCWRALRKPVRHDPRPWRWSQAGVALLLAASYAVTDEIHQSFVPTRQGSPWDVLLDSAGAAAGMFVLWSLGRWRKYW